MCYNIQIIPGITLLYNEEIYIMKKLPKRNYSAAPEDL